MNPPKGRGEPVLYLDYDGVLHHDACFWHPRRGVYLQAGPGYSLFQHALLLDELLAPYPNVLIVLSTSWVRIYRCAGAANRLPAGLRSRVIGATYHSQIPGDSFWDMPRWRQIHQDVQRRLPGSWLALDNDVADWPDAIAQNLVATDDVEGISPAPIQEEIQRRLALLANLKLSPKA